MLPYHRTEVDSVLPASPEAPSTPTVTVNHRPERR
jgi:hypothetical protein